MKNISDNKSAVDEKMKLVKAHCMCAKFEDDGRYFRVIYPPGDFATHGAQANYGDGKAIALDRLLAVMERHWIQSFV